MNNFLNRFFTFRIIIIAFIVWLGLCLVIAGSIYLLSPYKVINVVPTAVITIVYAPTQAPPPTPPVGKTVTPQPGTPPAQAIQIGNFVQINGTAGEGLRIRSAPGIENGQLFIANEAEVFEVKDGPVASGDYAWWYILSPKDNARFGWAAGNYLMVITKP